MPFDITSASGKGRIFGMGDWGDDDLIVDVERPTPGASLVVNDWFWGGGPPAPTVIPWTWLRTPLEQRASQPINYATIDRVNGATAVSGNAASQTAYGTFSAQGSLDTFSPDDAYNLATWLTTYYASPLLRAPVVTMSLVYRTTEERWRILGREIGDRIVLGPATVQDYPGHTTVLPVPAGLPAAVQSFVIAGIRHTSSVDARTVEWTTGTVVAPAAQSYLQVPSGSYASMPNDGALNTVGDLDLRADISADAWVPGAFQVVLGKYNSTINQKSYYFGILSGGQLAVGWSTDGTTEAFLQSTTIPSIGNGQRLAIRATLKVNDGSGNKVATFYTAPTIDGTWTQLGATVTNAGTITVFASTAPLSVGAVDAGATAPFSGKIHDAQFYYLIGGAPITSADFRPQAAGTTSFVDAANRTWTVQGSASIVAGTPRNWFRLSQSTLDGPDVLPF